ncbi:methyltransferase domain-containing protein [Streptomyces armeniacus]|uniref:Protein-L-isoaspartate O-methyltransferase n=2 Tax=Streptomyces armeniacus TaxID=83291 RepID=A0A345Y1E8_9ACTN|nr:methyltransferase domain-containing protein [Streptomyces armeniacus]
MNTGQSFAVRRSERPEVWEQYAAADVPLVTQWDDGQHVGPDPGRVPTSSASMPSVVMRMLNDLDAQHGQRVLEIGTGTGWNAALLAHQLGNWNVVSVEVDSGVANQARSAISRAGLGVEVVNADGADGHPPGCPYDRVIATCGLRSIPYAWLQQCRPGAVIVAPWGSRFSNQDALVRLVVADDGRSASGRFTGPVEFMKLRSQRQTYVDHSAYVTGSVAAGDQSATTVTEAEVLGEGRFPAVQFVLGLTVPHCTRMVADKRDGARPVWFYGLTDRSWACVLFRDGEREATVWQSGPRRLWDQAESALVWWAEGGRPGHDRFGLTTTARGQRAWLDDPDNSWVVPSAQSPTQRRPHQ